ncbi:hypothetical protein HDV05_006891 [Chytridiales sp. JEL 0842]|nr:hypothetical protein HDV05_006891 [Chytridiales sp. JEL 0842]
MEAPATEVAMSEAPMLDQKVQEQKAVRKGKALWDYSAIEDNEISFHAGDIIEVLDLCNNDWYEGRLGDVSGYFPANRIELLPESEPPPAQVQEVTSHETEQTNAEVLPPTDLASTLNPDESKDVVEDPFGDDTENVVEGAVSNDTAEKVAKQDPEADTPSFKEGKSSTIPEPPIIDESMITPNHDMPPSLEPVTPVAHSSSEESKELPSGWQKVTDEDGQPFYWHEASNKVTWELPSETTEPVETVEPVATVEEKSPAEDDHEELPASESVDELTNHFEITEKVEEISTNLEGMDLSQLESIPADLILKDGPLKKKMVKDDGTKESRISSAWKSCHGVICPGFLIVLKEPINTKNKKPYLPIDVISLLDVTIEIAGKEQTSKKNAFIISSNTGRQWLFVPEGADASTWIEPLRNACQEKITAAEFDGAAMRLFSKLDPALHEKKGDRTSRTRRLTPAKDTELQKPSSDSGAKNQVRAKIGAFFKRPATTPKNKESTEVNAAELTFGGYLELQLDKENGVIPKIVEMCCSEVEKRGLTSVGIYRLSGNASTVLKVKNMVNQQEEVKLDDEDMDINVVTSVLKCYFRELKNPLIPFELYEEFIKAAKIDDYNERLWSTKTLVQSLPQSNYFVLEYLIRHLTKVADQCEENKMQVQNLAIVFAPTLIRRPEEAALIHDPFANMPFHNKLLEDLLNQCDWFFDGKDD